MISIEQILLVMAAAIGVLFLVIIMFLAGINLGVFILYGLGQSFLFAIYLPILIILNGSFKKGWKKYLKCLGVTGPLVGI